MCFFSNLFDNYVNEILDGDLSEVDGFSDDEDADPTFAPIAVLERHPEDDQSSEEKVDNAVQQPAPSPPPEPQPAPSSRYTWNMTVRTVLHFIDFSLAFTWIQRRRQDKDDGTPRRDQLDFLDFKVGVAYALMNSVHNPDVHVEDDREAPEEHPVEKEEVRKRMKTTPSQ
ncbi:hypothetical protein J6590_088608 [Homalodisca vitripennis]|nr:hypothetical protein J6590_088608 [Homalodisca vitripennis]